MAALISFRDPFMCSQTKTSWSHIDFSSTQFENYSRGLNVSLLHSPPNLGGLDEQNNHWSNRYSWLLEGLGKDSMNLQNNSPTRITCLYFTL
ncbi:hypothetical protein ACTXT7_009601 [Hymenolepis weldensis]